MSATPDADARGELDELLCFDLYATSRAVTRRYRPLLEDLGLTYPQYLVVVVLGGAGPLPIKSLAATLRLDHATLTPLLRRLEEAGVLTRERDPHDRRSVRLALTGRGRELHAHSAEVQRAIRGAIGLSDEQVHALQAVLREVGAAAGE
jgi:DNA-binding MarR family transcriptional regulator